MLLKMRVRRPRRLQGVQARVISLLIEMLAGLALALAVAGLYGILSYSMTERRREIGIRIAMGAANGDIFKMVIGQGLKLVVNWGRDGAHMRLRH
jgi:ABC-type lipoprotein release transport system permease subunit